MAQAILMERVERLIYLIRGHKVMLDSDLAELYGVSTKRLNEQVRRNSARFPSDFMFQLTSQEADSLRSQFATLKQGRGRHRKYLPHAFSEQGVAMLSSVLNSEKAIQVNIAIMRAFVKFRQILAAHKELARKLAELERKLEGHNVQIRSLFEAIRQLMAPPPDVGPKGRASWLSRRGVGHPPRADESGGGVSPPVPLKRPACRAQRGLSACGHCPPAQAGGSGFIKRKRNQ